MSALWKLCRPFWGGWRSWRAWSLLAVAVSMGFGIVYLNVQINEWSRVFYDTLGTYYSSKLFGLMKEYTVYILLYIGVFVSQDWFTSLLVIRWRSALTAQFVDSWLAKRTFYRMSLTGKIDNRDQRIAEDINLFTDKLVSMVVAFIINAGRLSSFMIILWHSLACNALPCLLVSGRSPAIWCGWWLSTPWWVP